MPSDYTEHPEKYFVPLSDTSAKKYTKSHLEDNSTGYVPGVVIMRNREKHIFDFEHETTDVISTWVELLALTRSHYEGCERSTFIFDSPYELRLDEKNDFFVLTVADTSHVKGAVKRHAIQKRSFLQGILHGATDVHHFFANITKSHDLKELKDNIIFLNDLYSRTSNE
ncbi:hypothetical protein P5G51_013975 [Virgibacillus sp. 179-BFC.A HS]|uniref:Uncharacterized protein n=1 Tax=Tigheibacillus jepli TaxID=3035914 RepID=A0ABU5CK89_9BACI|nr:hypothetical protein [Virgibacillus sp. 179-BFC.A HS]MDY0406346.1 hypothetical protein [Virgibacillus sp. 179-BFC.A HS]